LEHTHPLLHSSPSITQYLRTNEMKDPEVMGIIDQMHRCDASHNTMVNVLSELYGGGKTSHLLKICEIVQYMLTEK
ncbi:hypothetical protein BAE44_0008832, partial [Dichanthelium oligosanthes]